MNINLKGPGLLLAGQVSANALVGYLFQRLLAWRLGVGVEKSAFDIAFSIPFAVMYVSGIAMSHTVIVAYMTRIRPRDNESRSTSLSAILNVSLLSLSAVVVIGLMCVGSSTNWLAPGFSVAEREALKLLIEILLPLSVPLGIGMLLSAASFASGVPISQELLLAGARIIVIVGAVCFPEYLATATDISLFLLICTSALVILQVQLLKRGTGLRWGSSLRLSSEDRNWLVSRLTGFLLIAVNAQLAALYYRSQGTIVSAGFVAAAGLAVTLIEPIGTAFGRVIVFLGARTNAYPWSPMLANMNRPIAVFKPLAVLLAFGSGLALLITLASNPVVELLYGGGGKITSRDLHLIAEITSVYCWTLPAVAVSWTLLTFSINQSKYGTAAIYISGYIVQILYLWILGPGDEGAYLLLGYLIPVWWQSIALVAAAIWTSGWTMRVDSKK